MSSDRRFPDRWLGPGAPAAPGVYRLGLLPSGPDPIHETPPRRTRPSTPRARCKPDRRHARAGNSVPHIEDFGFRAPLAPHLARKEHCSPLAVLLRRRAGTRPGTGGLRVGGGRTAAGIGAPADRPRPETGAAARPREESFAEGAGFEPARELAPPTRFPGVRTRPDYAIPPYKSEILL